MSKTWHAYAQHILDAIAKIRRIEQRGSLIDDEVLFDAALRNLQTLAEATQMLPDALKTQFSTIPWREISGFRNILVHNYLGDIDPLTVSSVITTHLQAIEECMKTMLKLAQLESHDAGGEAVRRKIEELGITEKDIADAIKWARDNP